MKVVLLWQSAVLALAVLSDGSFGFTLLTSIPRNPSIPSPRHHQVAIAQPSSTRTTSSSTSLFSIVPVPDNFFMVTGFGTGLFIQFSRAINRSRMEELAWEQRLDENREKRMAEDPTVTEIDLRKQEAANEWSAYGPEAMAERERVKQQKVKVKEREYADYEGDDQYEYRRDATEKGMTDEEIKAFEREFGVDYDPYYDDPYIEDELPDDMTFTLDRRYGDRIYENGEIFYCADKKAGVFYRQGGKPRVAKLWEFK